jgi:transcriptional regulator with XRE-family HTH domain
VLLRIIEISKELGFSQKDLGKHLDISQRALCSYECGTRTFPLFLLPKNCKNFKCFCRKIEQFLANEQKVVFTLIDLLAGKQTAAHA